MTQKEDEERKDGDLGRELGADPKWQIDEWQDQKT